VGLSLSREINDTYEWFIEWRKLLHDSIIIAKTVWNAILDFYIMELREEWVLFFNIN